MSINFDVRMSMLSEEKLLLSIDNAKIKIKENLIKDLKLLQNNIKIKCPPDLSLLSRIIKSFRLIDEKEISIQDEPSAEEVVITLNTIIEMKKDILKEQLKFWKPSEKGSNRISNIQQAVIPQ